MQLLLFPYQRFYHDWSTLTLLNYAKISFILKLLMSCACETLSDHDKSFIHAYYILLPLIWLSWNVLDHNLYSLLNPLAVLKVVASMNTCKIGKGSWLWVEQFWLDWNFDYFALAKYLCISFLKTYCFLFFFHFYIKYWKNRYIPIDSLNERIQTFDEFSIIYRV